MRAQRGAGATGLLAGCAFFMLIPMLLAIGFYGFFAKDNPLIAPTGATFATGETHTGVEATAYVPRRPDVGYCDASGGGPNDMKSKPVEVLPHYLAKKAPYVSVAIDSAVYKDHPYGTKVRIPELEKMFNDDKGIDFRLVDTGSDFKGDGYTHIDIAVDCEMLKDWKNPKVTLIIASDGQVTAAPFDCNGKKFAFPIVSTHKIPINSTHHDYSATDIFVLDGKRIVLGDSIVSITDGEVVSISKQNSGDGGVTVRIVDRDNISYYYAHLQPGSNRHLSKNEKVTAGQVIGKLGETGNARGYGHLHLGIAKREGPQHKGFFPSQKLDPRPQVKGTSAQSSHVPLKAWKKGECADPRT